MAFNLNNIITQQGLKIPSYTEIRVDTENDLRNAFAPLELDFDDRGVFGQLVSILSYRESLQWEAIAELLSFLDTDKAQGTALDRAVGLVGITRQAESPTVVNNVLLIGQEGTIIPTGTLIRLANGSTVPFRLLGQVELSLSSLFQVTLEIPSTFTDYTSTTSISMRINNIDYDVELGGDKATFLTNIRNELRTVLGVTSVQDTTDDSILIRTNTSFSFSLGATTALELVNIGNRGNFQATQTGAIDVPINAFDSARSIITPITGWDSIFNANAGILGREQETDEQLRIRKEQSILTGNATLDAIIGGVSNNVPNVTRVAGEVNSTIIANASGLPPKSFHIIVDGGDETRIAQEIWNRQGAGIESFGTEEETIMDSQGVAQIIKFSRSVAVPIQIAITITNYNEENILPNEERIAQIKQILVQWGVDNLVLGKDIIPQRMFAPIYDTVTGVDTLNILVNKLGQTASTARIPIAINEYGLITLDNTTVTITNT